MLLVVEEAKQFSGTSAKGKPYDFTQRRLEVFANKKTVVCVERLDPKNGKVAFRPYEEGEKVEFKVGNPRVDNGAVVFEIL